jgi:hypothetical protein
MSGESQHVDVVDFHLELRLRHGYSRWRDVSKSNSSKESYFLFGALFPS